MGARPLPRNDDSDVITAPRVVKRNSPITSSGMCIVGCKLPSGLQLQLSRPEPITEQTPSGSRQITIHRKHGDIYFAKGNRVPFGVVPDFLIIHGAALTPNIPRDFMREWMEQNKNSDVVRNQLIFIQNDEPSARDQAKDLESHKSGLEPLDPAKLPEVLGRRAHITMSSATTKDVE